MGLKRWSYSDRRRLLRVACRLKAEVTYGRSVLKGEVRELSLGGLQLLCEGRVKEGDRIRVRIHEVGASVRYDIVTCRVRWTQKSGPNTLLGACFTEDESYMTRSWVLDSLKKLGREASKVYQKREAVRVECALPATLRVGKDIREARLRDLGLNGARVECEGAVIEHGTLLTLGFGPHKRLPPVSVLSEVILVRGHRIPHYGLSFDRFEQGGPAAVERYLEFFFEKMS